MHVVDRPLIFDCQRVAAKGYHLDSTNSVAAGFPAEIELSNVLWENTSSRALEAPALRPGAGACASYPFGIIGCRYRLDLAIASGGSISNYYVI